MQELFAMALFLTDMDQALHEHNFVLKESNSAINSRWFYWFSDCIREDLLDVLDLCV